MADGYQTAQASLNVASVNAGKPALPAEEAREQTFLERLQSVASNFDVKARLADLQRAVDKATDHIIDLMVVFAMQTVVLPLILAWGLLKVAGGLFNSRPT